MKSIHDFEVLIIGGSYAGLSAAMSLGRSLRQVMLIDSGLPCNRQTPHSHNFLTQDGQAPGEIARLGRQQVEKYETVKFHTGLAVSGKKLKEGFEITTDTNEKFRAKKLIFATGIKDIIPDIPGFEECWGISIVHCPYCHGYEYRNQNTAIIANGGQAFHIASLVSNLTDRLTLLTGGTADFTPEELARLNDRNIHIIETPILEIDHRAGHIRHVVFTDKTRMSFDAAYAVIPFVQHSDIPSLLGCDVNEQGYLQVDAFQKTTVGGVYACGDNSSMMRSVANAVNSGNVAGAVINGELSKEQF